MVPGAQCMLTLLRADISWVLTWPRIWHTWDIHLMQDPANHQGSLAWSWHTVGLSQDWTWHTLGAFLVWFDTQ